MDVAVAVGVSVGVGVGVNVGVEVGVAIGVGVAVGATVGGGSGVGVGRTVGEAVAVAGTATVGVGSPELQAERKTAITARNAVTLARTAVASLLRIRRANTINSS